MVQSVSVRVDGSVNLSRFRVSIHAQPCFLLFRTVRDTLAVRVPRFRPRKPFSSNRPRDAQFEADSHTSMLPCLGHFVPVRRLFQDLAVVTTVFRQLARYGRSYQTFPTTCFVYGLYLPPLQQL